MANRFLTLDLSSFISSTMPMIYLEKAELKDTNIPISGFGAPQGSNTVVGSKNVFGITKYTEVKSFDDKQGQASVVPQDKPRDGLLQTANELVVNLVLGTPVETSSIMSQFEHIYVYSLLVTKKKLIDLMITGKYNFSDLNEHISKKDILISYKSAKDFISQNLGEINAGGILNYSFIKNAASFLLDRNYYDMAIFNFIGFTYRNPKLFYKSFAQYGPVNGEILKLSSVNNLISRYFIDNQNSIWAGPYISEVVDTKTPGLPPTTIYTKGLVKELDYSAPLTETGIDTSKSLILNNVLNYSKFIDNSSESNRDNESGVNPIGKGNVELPQELKGLAISDFINLKDVKSKEDTSISSDYTVVNQRDPRYGR